MRACAPPGGGVRLWPGGSLRRRATLSRDERGFGGLRRPSWTFEAIQRVGGGSRKAGCGGRKGAVDPQEAEDQGFRSLLIDKGVLFASRKRGNLAICEVTLPFETRVLAQMHQRRSRQKKTLLIHCALLYASGAGRDSINERSVLREHLQGRKAKR